jgi:hypothetical protein
MSDNVGIYYQTITASDTANIGNCTWTTLDWMPCQSNGIEIKGPIIGSPANVNKIEGVEIMKLYDVYLVYAENRKNPYIKVYGGIVAKDPEDAKVKSGLMREIKEEWDADYLTFITREIGEVKVKEKPKEVKNING